MLRQKRLGFCTLSFLIGLVVGLALSGATMFVWVQRETQAQRAMAMQARMVAELNQAQAQEALASAARSGLELAENQLSQVSPNAKSADGKEHADEPSMIRLGDALVDDLRQGRSISVQRMFTKSYQEKLTPEAFEKLVQEHARLRDIPSSVSLRESKIRKLTGGEGFEYYCTAQVVGTTQRVNFAFTFVRENGEWRISECSIKSD